MAAPPSCDHGAGLRATRTHTPGDDVYVAQGTRRGARHARAQAGRRRARVRAGRGGAVLVPLLLACAAQGGSAQTVSVDDCSKTDSCSPAACTRTYEPTCAPERERARDWATALRDLKCKVCAQSKARQCTYLVHALRTKGGKIKAAYCNDEFLVIAAEGLPSNYNAETYLGLVPLPPGDSACRVRTARKQTYVYKIPLNPVKLSDPSVQTIPNPLPNVPGLPAAGAIGVAVDGVPMYPNYNDRGQYVWTSCGVDKCNAHSGKGGDYHYHGDPFGVACLYDMTEYSGYPGDHPPLIGFAFDGYSIHGRHTKSDQDNVELALDACGGHDHGPYGYHYHPQVEEGLSSTLDGAPGGSHPYTAYKLSPMTCWRGSINAIPNFWDEAFSQVQYDSSRADTLTERNDIEQIRPCCGMSSYYVDAAAEIILSLTAEGAVPPPPQRNVVAQCTTAWSRNLTCCIDADVGRCCPSQQEEEGGFPKGCNVNDFHIKSDPTVPPPPPSPPPPPPPSPPPPSPPPLPSPPPSPLWTYPVTRGTWLPAVQELLGNALNDAVTQGDGGGVDLAYRNSGVVIEDIFYYAVNAVRTVDPKDSLVENRESYYPKSIVKANRLSDRIVRRYEFGSGSTQGLHDIDMAGLTLGSDYGKTYLYIGDAYNYIYQLHLKSGRLEREWNVGVDLGIPTVRENKGVESIAYDVRTNEFYVGVLDPPTVYVFTLDPACTSCRATPVRSFPVAMSPSGMQFYGFEDALYVLAAQATSGDSFLYKYLSNGTLACAMTIPSAVGIARADGFFIDGNSAYIADSLGPQIKDSLGYSLIKVQWTAPCGGQVDNATVPSPPPPTTTTTAMTTASPTTTTTTTAMLTPTTSTTTTTTPRQNPLPPPPPPPPTANTSTSTTTAMTTATTFASTSTSTSTSASTSTTTTLSTTPLPTPPGQALPSFVLLTPPAPPPTTKAPSPPAKSAGVPRSCGAAWVAHAALLGMLAHANVAW